MTILAVALKSLRGRLVTSALTACAVALEVALGLSTFLLTRGIKEGFIQGTTDFNLIIGAKGSPTQLVLNVIFRIDVPPPNMFFTVYAQLHDDTRVDVAVPVMLGDAFQGFRSVATTPEYFRAFPWRRQTFALARGQMFSDDPPGQPSYTALFACLSTVMTRGGTVWLARWRMGPARSLSKHFFEDQLRLAWSGHWRLVGS
jgi:putative ABC transport system permease protein